VLPVRRQVAASAHGKWSVALLARYTQSIGRQATDGSVALLAASVVVSGLIDAADPKPRGLPSRAPDLP
jgi:hypothetical protein